MTEKPRPRYANAASWPYRRAHLDGAGQALAAGVVDASRCGFCARVFSEKRVPTWVGRRVLCRVCARRLDGGGPGR